jgi:ElaB/YqjD/DUF883 family membrane-anchored ribosome-binding protein
MSNDDTTSELEKLRAELAALKAAQGEPPTPSAGQAASVQAASEQAGSSVAGALQGAEDEVKEQLDELVTLLEHEIRDLPAITCLAVFSMGILMGRLLR